VIFNVIKNTFISTSKYFSNQILVKKNRFGEIQISNFIYVADSAFYAEKGYNPLSINFTGYIIEINENKKLEYIYQSEYGDITASMNKTEYHEIVQNMSQDEKISFRDAEEGEDWEYDGDGDGCPDAAGGKHIKHRRSGSFTKWIMKVFSGKGSSELSGSGTTTVIIFGRDWTMPNGSTGSLGNTGGGGGSPELPCENPKTFWDTYGKPTYKNYIEALSILPKEFGLSICDDIFSNSSGSSVSYENILCGATGCFSGSESNYISLDHFLQCLRTFFSNVADNDRTGADCQMALKNFNQQYATNYTLYDILDVWDGDPDICGDPEKFKCETNKYLFFKRADIQQIIADNSLLDACNPGLTSRDIFNTYAYSNCADDLCSMPLDKILKDIGKGGGKMNKTESFLQCKALNCLFDALWEKGTTNFCELQDNFESDSKIIDITIGTEEKFLNNSDRAYVSIDQMTGRITMYFNPKFCVPRFYIETTYPYADFINSAKTIIHESIHADFWRQATILLPDGKTLSPIDGVSWIESVREFLNIICTDGDGITDQHEEMISFWKVLNFPKA
jgi:hypothetical protein